jgi:hypothetical protein
MPNGRHHRGGLFLGTLLLMSAPIVHGEPDACGSNPFQVTDAGPGLVRQCGSGLIWTKDDNNRGRLEQLRPGFVYANSPFIDTSWQDARNWCEQKGGGWRLPTSEELLSLYDSRLPCTMSSPCNKVSRKFGLSSKLFWSSDIVSDSAVWIVDLSDGFRSAQASVKTSHINVLCVGPGS